MIQEPPPDWPDGEPEGEGYTVPHSALVRLGRGDASVGRRLLRTLIDVESAHEPVTGPTPRPANVRIATEADEPAIMELLLLDHHESAARVAPFDAQHAASFVQAATREKDATIGVVDGPDGVVGMVYLIPEVWWFAPDWYVAERLLFVHPNHRKSRHDAHLLQFAKSFVDSMSDKLGYTVYLVSSVVGTRDVVRKTALFGRAMERGGGIFIYPSPPPLQVN